MVVSTAASRQEGVAFKSRVGPFAVELHVPLVSVLFLSGYSAILEENGCTNLSSTLQQIFVTPICGSNQLNLNVVLVLSSLLFPCNPVVSGLLLPALNFLFDSCLERKDTDKQNIHLPNHSPLHLHTCLHLFLFIIIQCLLCLYLYS